MKGRDDMRVLEFPEIKLTYNQKAILRVLKDEYSTGAYTKELLEDEEVLPNLTMNQITWNLNQLFDIGLVKKKKGTFMNRPYTKFWVSEFIQYDGVVIK